MAWDEAGEAVQRAALRRGAAGNGSVMRCAPVALRFRRDPARLVRASLDTARITHADPRCAWGAVAVNQAIVHLLDGEAIADVAAAAVAGVTEPAVREAVLGAADREEPEVRAGGYVLETVSAAFWCLARSPSFEEAVVAAIGLGDDADTTGAVAGALAGAAHGAAAIPPRWRELVQHRADLERLAAALLARAGG
jgi:ADP-ribosyl-[dinitrogen reductase] hydrolase